MLAEKYYPGTAPTVESHEARRRAQMDALLAQDFADVIFLQEADSAFVRELSGHPLSKKYGVVSAVSMEPRGTRIE